VDMAKKFGAKLVLLNAFHVEIPTTPFLMAGGPVVPPGFYDSLREHATQGVEELTKQAKGWGVEASGIAVNGPAAITIVEQAEKLSADLIVMGTRGNSGLKHLLLGSVAERVLQSAPCPVLTVRAED